MYKVLEYLLSPKFKIWSIIRLPVPAWANTGHGKQDTYLSLGVVIRSKILAKTSTPNPLNLRMNSNLVLPRFLPLGPAKKSKETETPPITFCASQHNWLSAGPTRPGPRRHHVDDLDPSAVEVKTSSENFGASFGVDIIEDNTRAIANAARTKQIVRSQDEVVIARWGRLESSLKTGRSQFRWGAGGEDASHWR